MSVAKLIREEMQSNEFWAGIAKFEFMIAVNKIMAEKSISKSELAVLIGKSPAYVTKLMTGDCNLTIESMVMISRALGKNFVPTIVEEPKQPHQSNVVSIPYSPRMPRYARVNYNG